MHVFRSRFNPFRLISSLLAFWVSFLLISILWADSGPVPQAKPTSSKPTPAINPFDYPVPELYRAPTPKPDLSQYDGYYNYNSYATDGLVIRVPRILDFQMQNGYLFSYSYAFQIVGPESPTLYIGSFEGSVIPRIALRQFYERYFRIHFPKPFLVGELAGTPLRYSLVAVGIDNELHLYLIPSESRGSYLALVAILSNYKDIVATRLNRLKVMAQVANISKDVLPTPTPVPGLAPVNSAARSLPLQPTDLTTLPLPTPPHADLDN